MLVELFLHFPRVARGLVAERAATITTPHTQGACYERASFFLARFGRIPCSERRTMSSRTLSVTGSKENRARSVGLALSLSSIPPER